MSIRMPLGTVCNAADIVYWSQILFSGSSGSLVITKPTNVTVSTNGDIISHTEKQFSFLGVYSEEPTPNLKSTDTAVCWYGNLLNIIAEGGRTL